MCDNTEELTLPALPSGEVSLPGLGHFTATGTRKRPFLRSYKSSSHEDQLAEALSTSSDPALFSSDETPDAENYNGSSKRRKKKTYTGTWWGGRLRRSRRGTSVSTSTSGTIKKREFRRNVDSGIFMNDDTSGTDLSSEGLLEQELLNDQEKGTCRAANKILAGESDELEWATSDKRVVPRRFSFSREEALKRGPVNFTVDAKDQLIRNVIQECLDKNREIVDYTDWGLDYLPPSITDLKSMIKRIGPLTGDNNLAPFEAELKIYLANNKFSRVPESLLELTNLSDLSIRQNRVTELPPGIRSLVNLRNLNLASNNIQCLPFEVLGLLQFGNLTVINHSPNPWMPLPPFHELLNDMPPVAIFSHKGVHFRRFAVGKPVRVRADGSISHDNIIPSTIGVQPHLSEVVLRALLRHNKSKTDLSSYLSDAHPKSVRNLLNILHSAQESGGRKCTFCKRDIVLPSFTWFEWWDAHNVSLFMTLITNSGPQIKHFKDVDYRLDLPKTVKAPVGSEYPQEVHDRLLPFQRLACGCTDIVSGLQKEADVLQRDMDSISPSTAANALILQKWHWI